MHILMNELILIKKIIQPRLAPKERFYSSLDNGKRGKGNGHISNEQYLHLQNVWNIFNFKTFRDFHNHYLKKKMYYYQLMYLKILFLLF